MVGLVALGREESQGGGELGPLSHPVGIALAHGAQLPVEVDLRIFLLENAQKQCFSETNLDLKVQVADIAGVWLHAEHPGHLVALLAGQVVVEVEYGLLPVGVPGNSDEDTLLWSQKSDQL